MIVLASDLLLVVVLLNIGLRGVFPTPGLWAVVGVLVLSSLLPVMARPSPPGSLRRDRMLFVGGLFLLLMPGALSVDLWLALPACGFLILGSLSAMSDGWKRERTEMLLAGVITIIAVAAVAGENRAIMAYLATAPKFPGRVEFLVPMVVWGCLWFGLDAHLRSLPGKTGPGLAGWVWDRRHLLGLCLAAAALFARQFVF